RRGTQPMGPRRGVRDGRTSRTDRGIAMNNPPRILSLLLSLGLAGLVYGQAQTVPQEPAPADAPKLDFADVDKNGDGNLTRDEALPVADLHASFDLLDVDRNQMLSPTEFAQWNRA